MLQQKRVIEEALWSNPHIDQFVSEDEQPTLAVTIFDLVRTFQGVLERAKNRPTYQVNREEVSIADMIQYLQHQLGQPRQQPISAIQLFERQRSRRAMICLFLAILELVKGHAVELRQSEAFGDIDLVKGSGFEESQQSVHDLATVEKEYR
jgi:segregation and condensation protein A